MTGYMTKYALTQGIVEVEVDKPRNDEARYVYTKTTYRIQLIVGKDFFESKVDAEAMAKNMAERKVASLEKSLAKMKKLADTPKWGKS